LRFKPGAERQALDHRRILGFLDELLDGKVIVDPH